MIVCRDCGTQNADDDTFCGGCPAFLEHSGELIVEEPAFVADLPAVDESAGLVTRIKQAITGDDLPPPSGAAAPGAVEGVLPSSPDPKPDLDDAERRAAALLARPPQQPDPPGRPPARGSSVTDGAGGTAAQKPQAAKPRPKVQQQAPSRKINPGDLICGRCGEGNPETRKFCRRCGESLVEAVAATQPWYRRVIPSRRPARLKAGERPDRGRSGTVGTKGRILRGKVLGRLADGRRVMALLAMVGIGVGFAIPSVRSTVTDGGSDLLARVRRVISPTYSNIPIEPSRVTSSSDTPGAEAERVADSNTLTFWQAAPDDPNPAVTIVFVETTDVVHVLVHPGRQEDGGKVVRPDPRPRELLFRVTDEAGAITEVAASITDDDGFQTVDLGVDAAVSVETSVVNCYPDPAVRVCPITELEFQRKD